MRWMSFEKDGKASFGPVIDGGVADAGASTGYETLKEAIAASVLDEIAADLDSADYGLNEVRYLPPITNPGSCA